MKMKILTILLIVYILANWINFQGGGIDWYDWKYAGTVLV